MGRVRIRSLSSCKEIYINNSADVAYIHFIPIHFENALLDQLGFGSNANIAITTGSSLEEFEPLKHTPKLLTLAFGAKM